MVALSLTAVPIFGCTCFRKPRLLLVIAFYLSPLRPEISAVCEDVQRQPIEAANGARLLFREMG